jgi:hypothetical protein
MVALKSNSPPGPLITSELKLCIERLITQKFYMVLPSYFDLVRYHYQKLVV